MAAQIRVGTCSWADEALTKYWYPKGVPSADRLGYYAEHFDTVEVDSTYYRLPAQEMVQRWAERTPDGFVMHVKAFGVMTRHPVKIDQLPPDMRDEAPKDDRGRVERPSREFRAEIFRRFLEALEPLRSTGKLGGLLFQFPPYVVPKEASLDYLAWAREQVGDDRMLVEFRHRAWYEEDQRDETLRFLEEHEMAHVVVDAPKTDGKNVPLTVLALTTPLLYMRFHGRNADTWNVRGGSASEDQLTAWKQFHEALLTDPGLIEVAADRMNRRSIEGLSTPGALTERLTADMNHESPVAGEITVELRGKGQTKTVRVLETYINALVSQSNAVKERRADGLPTIIP
jgi:uncharacterized protein YecE (DUF72 family)